MTTASPFPASGVPAQGDAAPTANHDDPAYWRAKAAAARAKARNLPWTSDPELRAQVDAILAMPPIDRLRQIEAQSNFFASLVPANDRLEDD